MLFWERNCNGVHSGSAAYPKLSGPWAILDPTLLHSPAPCLSWIHLENAERARERGVTGSNHDLIKLAPTERGV